MQSTPNPLSEDQEYTQKIKDNFIFHVKGTKATYRLYSEKGVCTATQAQAFSWHAQDNSSYWTLNQIQNSLFQSKVYKCKNVDTFSPSLIIEKIPSGYFHAYFRHGGNQIQNIQLTVYRVYPDGREVKIESMGFKTFGESFNLKNEAVFNTYAVTLDLSKFEGETVDIKFELFKKPSDIQDYIFEGIILVPENDILTAPLNFFKIQQDDLLKIDWEQRADRIQIIKIPSENEYRKLEEDDDNDPIESFEQANLEEVSEKYRETVRTRFTEYWDKYDIERNNFLLQDQFIALMKEINHSFRIHVEDRKVEEEFQRADKRKLGSVFKHNILWLVQKTADRLERTFIQQEMKQQAQAQAQANLPQLNKSSGSSTIAGDGGSATGHRGSVVMKPVMQMDPSKLRELQDKESGNIRKKLGGKYIELVGKVRGETSGKTHEGPENLVNKNEGSSKWCVTGSKWGVVYLELSKDISFNVFGLKAANDAPNRDPVIVRLYQMGLAVDKLGEGIQIFEREQIGFQKRYDKKLYKLDRTITGNSFKIYLESNSNEMQLCQVLFANVD